MLLIILFCGILILFVSLFFCLLHQQQMHGTLTFLLIPSSQIKPAPHRQTVVSPLMMRGVGACLHV